MSDLAEGLDGALSGHEDRDASLSVCIGEEGRILLKCFAGCENTAIVNALGLTMADLMPKRDGARVRRGARRVSAEYTYRDEKGRVLFEVVRIRPERVSPAATRWEGWMALEARWNAGESA